MAGEPGASVDSRYANYFEIGYNEHEFVIAFGQAFTGDAKPELLVRIITTPHAAGVLLGLLQSSIEEHRRAFALRDDMAEAD